MSEQHSAPIKFTCYNDCASHGCPSHEMVCHISTAGYLRFEVDGEPEPSTGDLSPIYDPRWFEAMWKAYQSANE